LTTQEEPMSAAACLREWKIGPPPLFEIRKQPMRAAACL